MSSVIKKSVTPRVSNLRSGLLESEFKEGSTSIMYIRPISDKGSLEFSLDNQVGCQFRS